MTLVVTSGSVELKALEVLDDSLGKCKTARLVLALAATVPLGSINGRLPLPTHLCAGAEAAQLQRQLAKMECS